MAISVKKLCAALLALLMTASLFVSCAAQTTSEESGVTESSAGTTAEETEITRSNYPDNLPASTFDGREFRISCTDKYEYEMYVESATGDVCDDAVYNRNTKIEDKYGIVIVPIVTEMEATDNQEAHDGFINKTVAAGDDAFDLAGLYVWRAGKTILNGYLNDWNNIGYVDFSQPWWSNDINDAFTVAGHEYVAVSDLSITALQMTYAYLFNKKLVADNNIKDIYDTVSSNGWTIDYVASIVKAVYSDVDGDGAANASDVYGFVGDTVTGLDAYLPAFDQPIISNDADGIPYIAINTERTVTAVNKIYSLYYENAGSYVVHYDEKYDMFKSNQAMLIQARIIRLYSELRDMDVDYGIVPYPKFDETQSQYLGNSLDNYSVLCVPVTVSDLDYVGFIIEALSAESYRTVVPAYYDIALQSKYTRDEISVDMLDIIMKGRRYDLSILHGGSLNDIPYFFRNLIAAKNNNFASKYAAIEDKLTANLAKLVEQYGSIGQ